MNAGAQVEGKCSDCGRQGVRGTLIRDRGNGLSTAGQSTHSHRFGHDDGEGRGNGVVDLEHTTLVPSA